MSGAIFERNNASLLSKPEKLEPCPSCDKIPNPHNGDCACSP